jgi:hypothetical protein
MEAWMVLVLIGANIPVYIGIGRVVFGSWENFGECLRFWFTPDIFSMLRGEFTEDAWAEFKLLYFVAVCAVVVWVQYVVIERLFFV